MSNVTPPGPAGADRLTVNVYEVVPALPSFKETSLIVRFGNADAPLGVTEISSIASPSSAPEASVSVQRIKKLAPFGMLKPVMVELRAVRSPAALPFFAPIVAVSGVMKLSAATPVYVPVERSVASVLISKLI